MFKEVFHQLDLTILGEVGMLIFFGTFVAVTVWAATRPRREIQGWSCLPLDDSAIPHEPRTESGSTR